MSFRAVLAICMHLILPPAASCGFLKREARFFRPAVCDGAIYVITRGEVFSLK